MQERLKEINTDAIKQLVNIKKEQDKLSGFRAKAEEMKEKVDESVYQRVLDDYDSREWELEQEAIPLKAEARAEYQKLRAIFEELEQAREQAREDKEELEFRRAVGELNQKQLTEQLKEPEGILEKCEAELAQADKLKKQFVQAFHSEEELEAEAGAPVAAKEASEEEGPAEEGPAEEEPAEEEPADEEPADEEDLEEELESTAPVAVGDETGPVPDDAVPAEGEPPADATYVLSTEEPPADKTFVLPDATSPEGTFVVPQARLVMVEDGEELAEFHLGVLNYLGRGDDNHIQIPSPRVSRKHAQVSATPQGFKITDLDTANGTFVNEERISEHELQDGDRVRVGDVELVFHASAAS